jgi:Fe-S-cluster containining protein
MPILDPSNPLAFFKALHREFGAQLSSAPDSRATIEGLLGSAFESFERNVEQSQDGIAAVACHGGCASCCTIRVAATAPEILLVARAIRALPEESGRELKERIDDADRATRRLSPLQRMLASLVCPFIDQDLCVIYPVRPLACRGHASFDKQACVEALAGRACEVPISAAHVAVRSLVQNAMQAALRDAKLPWATYELNQSLQIALSDENSETAWLNGEDKFKSALISDISLEEMAETFDAIKAVAV